MFYLGGELVDTVRFDDKQWEAARRLTSVVIDFGETRSALLAIKDS